VRDGKDRALRHLRQLVNELAEAADQKRLSRLVARYDALTCCCSTNWATCSSTPAGRALFQILTEREERSSVATATTCRSPSGQDRPRRSPGCSDHRPIDLSRPHHRDRFRFLPAAHHESQTHPLGATLDASVGVKELKRSGLKRPPCQSHSHVLLVPRIAHDLEEMLEPDTPPMSSGGGRAPSRQTAFFNVRDTFSAPSTSMS